jgi:hypothetical protein
LARANAHSIAPTPLFGAILALSQSHNALSFELGRLCIVADRLCMNHSNQESGL